MRTCSLLPRRLQVLLVTAWLAAAVPAGAGYAHLEPLLLGFTPDGQAFVFVERGLWNGDERDERAKVLDVRTWALLQEFDLDPLGEPAVVQKRRQVFERWRRAHPTACAGGLRSPDGKRELLVAFSGQDLMLGRDRDGVGVSVRYNMSPASSGPIRVTARVAMEQADGSDPRPLLTWRGQRDWGFSASFRPCWSPDGKRIALMAFRDGQGMRDSGDQMLYLLPQSGPRIELRTKKPRGPAAQAAALALDRAGFVVTRIKQIKESPPSVRVFTSSEYNGAIDPIAQAVAGSVMYGALPDMGESDVVVLLDDAAVGAAPQP